MNQDQNLTRRSKDELESTRAGAFIAPLVDIYENREELLVAVDMPGVKQDDVSIDLDKSRLTIEARRRAESPGTAVALEYRPAGYRRAFVLPRGIDAERIEAQLRSGVLTVRLPKSEAAKPRTIPIRTA